MRVFQAPKNQIGRRAQYEKYNMIDGSRTVNAQFGTQDEALELAGGYQKTAERPAAGYVRDSVYSNNHPPVLR